MARVKTKKESNTFVKGLITEAGPLTYPEDASLQDINFVLNKDGSRQRRFGLDYEDGYALKTLSTSEIQNKAINSYTWRAVGNDGNLDIAVIQIGLNLYFFDNNKTSVSASTLNRGAPVTLVGVDTYSFSMSTLNGNLLVATGDASAFILEYDSTVDVVSSPIPISIKIRDLFGITETGSFNSRPSTLTQTHRYNLRNQGWPKELVCSLNKEGSSVFGTFTSPKFPVTDPINYTHSILGVYPSLSDTIGDGRLASASSGFAVNTYWPGELEKLSIRNYEAPKGSFIINPFSRGVVRWLASGVFGLPPDTSFGGIKNIRSYSGRVFYTIEETGRSATDDNSPNLGSMIFFSQTADSIDKLGKCYSSNDPTSEEISDPLDTDGGFIRIPEIGEIYNLEVLGQSLFIFASNGVWEVSGGETYFSATNQVVNKVTDVGTINSKSIVAGESMLMYWTDGGIYVITIDEVALRGKAQNLTQPLIQSFYDGIDVQARNRAVGVFDSIAKQFRWLYSEGSLGSNNFYNRELVFDLNLEAFSTSQFGEFTPTIGDSPYPIGYVDLSSTVFTDQIEDVVVGATDVVVGGDQVTVSLRITDQSTKGSTKYWTCRTNTSNSSLTISSLSNLDFIDWGRVANSAGGNGVDAPATLLTGYDTEGDSELIKKNPYITVFLRRTETGFTDDGSGNLTPIEPSSCILQAQWDWTNSASAGRWSSEREVYRLPRLYTPTGSGDPFDYGFTVVKTKNKIRGKGSALSLLFKSSPGKNLHLYGWSREITAEKD